MTDGAGSSATAALTSERLPLLVLGSIGLIGFTVLAALGNLAGAAALVAIVPTIASIVNGHGAVAGNVQQLRASVGDTNGADLATMVKEQRDATKRLAAFEEYQHGRNHELANELAKVTPAIPLILEGLDALRPTSKATKVDPASSTRKARS